MHIFNGFLKGACEIKDMSVQVNSSKPFALVYSLCKHVYLGYLIEPHVVQLNQDGSYSLSHRRIFSNTASEFSEQIDEVDLKIIKLLDSIEQGNLIKRFYKKPIRPTEYFTTVFNEEVYDVARSYIDNVFHQAFPLLKGKLFFMMSKEGWPAEQELSLATSPCSILFHFRRNEHGVRYFPTIKYQDERIEFMFKEAQVIVNQPALLLLNNTLHYFDQELDGKKITPFLNKRFIAIPKSAEKNYFKRFVAPLIEGHNVYAQGFEIKTQQYAAVPVLELSDLGTAYAKLSLHFRYGPYLFKRLSDLPVSVKMDFNSKEDSYTFWRIKRSRLWEENRIKDICDWGLAKLPGQSTSFNVLPEQAEADRTYSLIDWLTENEEKLKERGFEIVQKEGEKQYLLGQIELNLDVREENDWFDIKALVHFGDYSIPFIELRDHIINHVREFVLPSGEIALIPEQWFSQFNTLFQLSTKRNSLGLKRHHLGLLQELEEGGVVGLNMKRKLQNITCFGAIKEWEPPKRFQGDLRPYQKAGYDWFQFLKTHGFGGCLADDMGLGKTVQTLALLQHEKERQENFTSFIVMPTSLIYNWLNEAEKFAPDLLVLNHTGSFRSRSVEEFSNYDVVLCTYGTVRMDAEFLQEFYFHYIILDESQNIKNASSKSFRAIRKLKGRHKLILTGTPIENSVADLWPQMEFINPGLLGGQTSFAKKFVAPIEKKKDEEQSRRLQALLKPFILRRTKAQVASELPEKTEKVFYCTMTEEQSDYYERVKSEFRNDILQQSLDGVLNRSGVQVLKGLSKLRQLANHPVMIDEDYEFSSGKFENVVHHLKNTIARGHKILVFSSFVKQMRIYRDYLIRHDIPYSYLDGSTTNRAQVVDEFRNNEEIQVFLISIKAGGVGLNLTEADYVFILDPWWNPAVEMQAIDRTHRIGQDKKVFIYKFISKDTVEEKILALQNKKKGISSSLIKIEDDFYKSLKLEDIQEILS